MRYSVMLSTAASFLLGGCSLAHYPDLMQQSMKDLNNNQVKAAQANLPNYNLYDANLKNLETGRLQQLANNYNDSAASYQKVVSDLASAKESPDSQFRNDLWSTQAATGDASIKSYQAAAFEMIWLYDYQALNYLAMGDLSVAVSWANEAVKLQTIKASDYQALMNAMHAYPSDLQVNQSDYDGNVQGMLVKANHLPASFINPFSDYLLGILSQANGDLPSAISAFQNGLKVVPNNVILRQALLQALVEAGERGQAASSAQGQSVPKKLANDQGILVFVFEQGNVPSKQVGHLKPNWYYESWNISIPYYNLNLIPKALPIHVSANGKALGDTEVLVDNGNLAIKSLAEYYPYMQRLLTRSYYNKIQALHLKGNSISDAADQVSIEAYVSDPDLRSWLSLPDNVQVMQTVLKNGDYTLTLNGDNVNSETQVSIKPKAITLVWVTQLGTHVRIKTFNLD